MSTGISGEEEETISRAPDMSSCGGSPEHPSAVSGNKMKNQRYTNFFAHALLKTNSWNLFEM
jgi:hypothetical protein